MLRPENVARGIYVAIMHRSALAACPFSHNQTLSAFRAAEATALGTGLGTVPLIPLYELCPVRYRFVAEHVSKERPARVRDGLRHLRALELGGIDITDHDERVEPHQGRRGDVVVVTSAPGNLPVDCASSALATSALRPGKSLCPRLGVTKILNRRAVRARRQRLQAKVNADCTSLAGFGFRNFALKVEVPAAVSVLAKGARSNVAANRAVIPEMESLLSVNRNAVFDLHDGIAERHPPERPLAAPFWPATCRLAASDKLRAHGLNGAGADTQVGRAPRRELGQIKSTGPFLRPLSRVLLRFAAEVPDKINCPRHLIQALCVLVFHSIPKGQDHG
jgi:hypothetical protein